MAGNPKDKKIVQMATLAARLAEKQAFAKAEKSVVSEIMSDLHKDEAKLLTS
jgi:hypothetical protein